MEQSVLVGGVNLVDKAKQQQEEIRAHQSKMRRQKEEEKTLSIQKKKQEDEILFAEQKYGSIKEEIIEKITKIKKIRPLVKNLKESIEDLQQQFEREKLEQSAEIKSLNRELTLLKLIVTSCIPEDHIFNIKEHCIYDEENQKMYIDKMDVAGCHRKVENEEIYETNSVYIEGIKDAVFGEPKISDVEDEEMKKMKEKASKKKKVEANRLLNEFGFTDDMKCNMNYVKHLIKSSK